MFNCHRPVVHPYVFSTTWSIQVILTHVVVQQYLSSTVVDFPTYAYYNQTTHIRLRSSHNFTLSYNKLYAQPSLTNLVHPIRNTRHVSNHILKTSHQYSTSPILQHLSNEQYARNNNIQIHIRHIQYTIHMNGGHPIQVPNTLLYII